MGFAARIQPRALAGAPPGHARPGVAMQHVPLLQVPFDLDPRAAFVGRHGMARAAVQGDEAAKPVAEAVGVVHAQRVERLERSEEHTSELQSLMRISYAVFCLKKKIKTQQ